MPVIINNISCGLDQDKNDVIGKALRSVGLKNARRAEIYKTSLDARKRAEIHFVYSVYLELDDDEQERLLCERFASASYAEECSVKVVKGSEKSDGRICIAGFGPAGMFCALLLAENGYKPIVFEKGSDAAAATAAHRRRRTCQASASRCAAPHTRSRPAPRRPRGSARLRRAFCSAAAASTADCPAPCLPYA